MNRSLALEDFNSPKPTSSPEALPPASGEMDDASPSLEAYENGYKNGWSDCAAAEAEERKAVGAQLAEKLRTAELTYETARADIFGSLAPFFEELVSTLLPRLAAESLGPMASEELVKLLEQDMNAEIQIFASPGACERLQRLMDAEGHENASVHAEPAFAESQVSLRVGGERSDIDLSEVIEKIAQAVRAFQAQIEHPTLTQGAA